MIRLIKVMLVVGALVWETAQPCIAATSPHGKRDSAVHETLQDHTILVVNASSTPIPALSGQACYMDNDVTEGQQIAPGHSLSVNFTEKDPSYCKEQHKSSCLYGYLSIIRDPITNSLTFHDVSACRASKITVDDEGATMEFGGPGKGPITKPIRLVNQTLADKMRRAAFFAWPTDAGCLLLLPGRYQGSSLLKSKIYHWDGEPCRSGELISGSGTLTEINDLRIQMNKPGKGRDFYQGTMVDGVWNGSVNHSDSYDGGDPPASDYGSKSWNMGCDDAQDVIDQRCFPHVIGSVPPTIAH